MRGCQLYLAALGRITDEDTFTDLYIIMLVSDLIGSDCSPAIKLGFPEAG